MSRKIRTAAEETTEAAALTEDCQNKEEDTMEEIMESYEPMEEKKLEEKSLENTEDNDLYVKFRKPYLFEDKTYEGIDLSGLEDLSGDDMIAVQRKMERSGHFSTLPELSVEYACLICARATSLPEEFFRGLPLKDSTRLKNKVTSFLYGGESE